MTSEERRLRATRLQLQSPGGAESGLMEGINAGAPNEPQQRTRNSWCLIPSPTITEILMHGNCFIDVNFSQSKNVVMIV